MDLGRRAKEGAARRQACGGFHSFLAIDTPKHDWSRSDTFEMGRAAILFVQSNQILQLFILSPRAERTSFVLQRPLIVSNPLLGETCRFGANALLFKD